MAGRGEGRRQGPLQGIGFCSNTPSRIKVWPNLGLLGSFLVIFRPGNTTDKFFGFHLPKPLKIRQFRQFHRPSPFTFALCFCQTGLATRVSFQHHSTFLFDGHHAQTNTHSNHSRTNASKKLNPEQKLNPKLELQRYTKKCPCQQHAVLAVPNLLGRSLLFVDMTFLHH